MIVYEDEAREKSTVKIRLRESFEDYGSGCEPLEFEVDFSGLARPDMDATINWKAEGIANEGRFFTDSNGFGIVRRDYKQVNDTIEDLHSEASANWYPINTAIFLENDSTQMLVMNDRP